MNFKNGKLKYTLFCLVVLLFASATLGACKSEKTGTEQKTSGTTDNPQVESDTPTPTVEAVQEEKDTDATADVPQKPQKKIEFTSSENYKSYLSVKINIPAGVQLKDVTYVGFSIDTESDLSLRLYAGDVNFVRSEDNELTYEEKKLEDSVVGTEDVTEDGVTVKKTKHNLTETVVKSTRYSLSAGENQRIDFTFDDHAKAVINKIPGRVLNLGIYAHNAAPSFSIHSVQIKTATNTYDIELAKKNITAFDGGSFELVEVE